MRTPPKPAGRPRTSSATWPRPSSRKRPTAAAEDALSAEDKAQLLRLARSAVTEFVGRGALIEDRTANPKFLEPRGVFVTLKKRGELRGCIGFIEAVAPLGQAVVRAAVYAATEDPRFPPVAADEVAGLEFEISVLTPPREIASPELVRVGRHGLIVTRGGPEGRPPAAGPGRERLGPRDVPRAGLPQGRAAPRRLEEGGQARGLRGRRLPRIEIGAGGILSVCVPVRFRSGTLPASRLSPSPHSLADSVPIGPSRLCAMRYRCHTLRESTSLRRARLHRPPLRRGATSERLQEESRRLKGNGRNVMCGLAQAALWSGGHPRGLRRSRAGPLWRGAGAPRPGLL